MEGEIKRHLRDNGWTVRAPRRLYELNGRLQRLRRELTRTLGRPASDEELARAAGVSEQDAAAAERLGVTLTPLPLERAEPPATEDVYTESEQRMLLGSCLGRLRERDRRIVHLTYYAGLSQREVARVLGVSQVQVSRSLARSLERCRRHLARETGFSNVVVPARETYTRSNGATRPTG